MPTTTESIQLQTDVAYNQLLAQEKGTAIGYALGHDPKAKDRMMDFIKAQITAGLELAPVKVTASVKTKETDEKA